MNISRFNPGKITRQSEASYSFSIAQNSSLTSLTSSPIPGGFPVLNPITKNTKVQNFLQKIQKKLRIFL